VRGTAGAYYPIGDPSAADAIVKAVQAQEATLIDSSARALHADNPTLPMVVAGFALIGVIGASRRWPS
jgi:hypothetical protein